MQLHLKQVQAFCETYPIIEKVLIVPAMTVGHDVTMALARTGVSWVNLRVMTVRQLAEADVLGELIGEGWVEMVRDVDLFLVDDLIPEVVKDLGDDYFAQQAPGLARSFLRTVHALRASGVEAVGGEVGHVRHRLLGGVYEAYVKALEKGKVFDNGVLYRRALEKGEKGEVKYAILDGTPLPGLAFEYVKKKTVGRLCRIGYGDMGVVLPAHCAGVRFAEVALPEVDGDVGVGGRVFGDGLVEADGEWVRLRETLGIETEIRGVLRDVRDGGIPLDEVEIVYTTENPYRNLLCDLVQRFEIPATFAEGMTVDTTRVGQALIGFYRWIGAGFLANEWVWLCRSGLVKFGEDDPTPQAVATLVRQARIGEGRARYGEALVRMKHRILEGDPDGDDAFRGVKISEIEAVEGVLERVFALVPEGASVTLEDVIGAGVQFLDGFVGRDEDEREEAAREALVGFLVAVKNSEVRKGPLRRLANRMMELMSGQTFGAASAKPNCVALAPLSLGGYTNRKHVYVVGMDEGAFPGGALEDPLLLDGERAGLSGELALQRTRPAEQVWHLARVLAMASGHVTLLSCRRSLADGRERYPAAVFQQAAQQMGIDEEDVEVIRALPEDVALALDDGEGLLAQYPFVNDQAYIQEAFAWLAAGQKARRSRAWEGVTRYDGWLGVETPELAITDQKGVYSPSRLEMLARCPYRYFLNAVLGVRPLEEPEDDPTRWLDPMAFGSLLHRLFKDFMETVKERGEKPNQEKHAVLIRKLLKDQVEEKKETEPIIHQAAFRADEKRLEQAAQVFLAVESDQENVDPIGFEVSFGFDESGELSAEEPVTVELAEDVKFRIRGKIDRVDEVEDGLAIWDYKTGSMSQYDERDLLKRGTHLQWALYAYALDVILKQKNKLGEVTESGYVFPGDREHGRKLSGAPPSMEDLANVLRPLFELVARGGFLHIQKAQECTYCAYNRVCGEEGVDHNGLEGIRETMEEDETFAKILDSLNRWMGV